MRILFATQVVLEQHHGAARHVIALSRELVRLGHEVTLIAPGREEAPPEGVRRVRPPPFLKPGARMEATLASLAFAELRRQPEVALVRLSASSSFCPLILSTRVPVALELNGRILEELRKIGRDERQIRVVQESLKTVVKRAKVLLAVEKKTAEHARRALGAKLVRVIHNGADLDVATPGDRSAARTRLLLPSDRPLIVLTGSLLPEIRLDLLIAAQRKLQYGLAVAGGGPREQELRLEVEHAPSDAPIHFLGSVPHGAAVDLIRAADVCVNVRDGDLGMRGLEYAAIGRRFVSFAVEGTERLESLYPKALDATYFVQERTPEALAEAIRAAVAAEARLGMIPPEAVANARSKLGWDQTAREVSDALEEIVTSGRARTTRR